jgi:hypothetical protein
MIKIHRFKPEIPRRKIDARCDDHYNPDFLSIRKIWQNKKYTARNYYGSFSDWLDIHDIKYDELDYGGINGILVTNIYFDTEQKLLKFKIKNS